jgi:hypothetical protein
VQLETDRTGAVIDLVRGEERVAADLEQSSIQSVDAIAVSGALILKVSAADVAAVAELKPEDVRGRVIALYVARAFGSQVETRYEVLRAIRRMEPALILMTGPGSPRQRRTRLIAGDQLSEQVPILGVREGEFATVIEEAPDGLLEWKLNAHANAPKQKPVVLRNAAAILRGSDPVLRDTYILLTAHYDHVGTKPDGEGDRIFNGANDDASGSASVMEIASTLAAMNARPKRSILFVALFGEELGLLGARYYGRHPLVALEKTIANVNLEHMGRTDSNDGPKIASATFTGFDFSEVPAAFEEAGRQTGITVYRDEKRSDSFFARSDNQALADLGIPAHTLCVAYDYSDYHGVDDEWEKIDYDNMAKVTRMVALGLVNLANSDTAPVWNDQNPKVKKYAEAARELRGTSAQ